MPEQLTNALVTPSATLATASITAGTTTAFDVTWNEPTPPSSGTYSLLFKGTAADGSDDSIFRAETMSDSDSIATGTWEKVGAQAVFTAGCEIDIDHSAEALTTALADKADLTGAAFTGPISAPSVAKTDYQYTYDTYRGAGSSYFSGSTTNKSDSALFIPATWSGAGNVGDGSLDNFSGYLPFYALNVATGEIVEVSAISSSAITIPVGGRGEFGTTPAPIGIGDIFMVVPVGGLAAYMDPAYDVHTLFPALSPVGSIYSTAPCPMDFILVAPDSTMLGRTFRVNGPENATTTTPATVYDSDGVTVIATFTSELEGVDVTPVMSTDLSTIRWRVV